MTKRIGVLGAGSWGVTISSMLAEKGDEVVLWEFNAEQAKELASQRSLSFFPEVILPKNIIVTDDLKKTIEKKDFLIFVVPSHTVREVARKISDLNVDLSESIIISATKGIENTTLKRMSEVISDEIRDIGNRIVALSGPSHAEEVCQKIPTTVTVASINSEAAKLCQETLMSQYFRVYTNPDIIGVETGGSLKNIFAIAAGISDGLGLGDNTKAALVTRGLRELIKLGVKMGGQKDTYFGLTGLGDLIVTCFSRHSRNRALGEKIGKGKTLTQAERELIMVAEGVKTTQSAHELAKSYGLELPIIEQVYAVLYENRSPREALQTLMTREAKPEMDLYLNI
ncbi:MAG: NAD(P)H-dependent glycerol-3-phosphate dehydrogenase [Elusimicrobia bacterium]|nr:NAD(P)H-dependent glycerol-3-phosphate dehydrogenase [Elusimicrobiota bacterium]